MQEFESNLPSEEDDADDGGYRFPKIEDRCVGALYIFGDDADMALIAKADSDEVSHRWN